MNLNQCREMIDEIDCQILALLNRRAEVSRTIGSLKLKAGLPITDASREAEVLNRVARNNSGDLPDEGASRIYQQILAESREIQEDVRSTLLAHLEIR